MATRLFAVNLVARALPPALPLLTFPDGSCNSSSSSPVAILATMIAQPIMSDGLFCPLGPLGMKLPRTYSLGPVIQYDTNWCREYEDTLILTPLIHHPAKRDDSHPRQGMAENHYTNFPENPSR